MADISFNTACKELKIAQIAQLNQFFQPLHLAHIYGHGFYLVSRMLMSKNVNNDVSKDSPIKWVIVHMARFPLFFQVDYINTPLQLATFLKATESLELISPLGIIIENLLIFHSQHSHVHCI